MDTSSVEIRSPRAAKIITSFFAVPCFAVAVLSLLSPFMPVFEGRQPTVWEGWTLGAAYFVLGAFIYWPTAKWRIFADSEGVCYHNGFKLKMVRWREAAAFYMMPHPQEVVPAYFQLVLFDAQQEILLRISPNNKNLPPQNIEQWRELWQFVATQLEGKEVDAPFVSFEPAAIAARSIEVDWKSKTVRWKIARVIGLICYALFWCGISMALMLYAALNYPNKQSGVGLWLSLAAFFLMFMGPMLPYAIWFQFKKRKIAREWETRDKIES